MRQSGERNPVVANTHPAIIDTRISCGGLLLIQTTLVVAQSISNKSWDGADDGATTTGASLCSAGGSAHGLAVAHGHVGCPSGWCVVGSMKRQKRQCGRTKTQRSEGRGHDCCSGRTGGSGPDAARVMFGSSCCWRKWGVTSITEKAGGTL